MIVLKTHIVPKSIGKIRLYDYVLQIFPSIVSRKGVKKSIAREEVIVNGKKTFTGYWLKPDDEISLLESSLRPPKAYELELDIIYEDEFMAVINKPAGIPVSGNQFRTIQNALIGNIQLSREQDALKWPKPVHRLDAPTCGLLIIAKTARALVRLGQQFEQKKIEKKYVAIVMGEIPTKGTIDSTIDDLSALSVYKKLQTVNSLRSGQLSLVQLTPKSGRTHQLRIHMASMDTPILGDKIYGNKGNILEGKGLFLCALSLQFNHPITEKYLDLKLEIPYKFKSRLENEAKRWKRYNH